MAAKVFISYRRDDSGDYAGRVHDRLEREFGSDLLFMDVDAIPLGANFTKVLREEVARCDVLLALIGANWLDARNEDGKRRLDNPSDYLRIEIATGRLSYPKTLKSLRCATRSQSVMPPFAAIWTSWSWASKTCRVELPWQARHLHRQTNARRA
jgi:hypothetical protein